MTDADICRKNGWGPGTILEPRPNVLARYKAVEILCVGKAWVFIRPTYFVEADSSWASSETCTLYELHLYLKVKPVTPVEAAPEKWVW